MQSHLIVNHHDMFVYVINNILQKCVQFIVFTYRQINV